MHCSQCISLLVVRTVRAILRQYVLCTTVLAAVRHLCTSLLSTSAWAYGSCSGTSLLRSILQWYEPFYEPSTNLPAVMRSTHECSLCIMYTNNVCNHGIMCILFMTQEHLSRLSSSKVIIDLDSLEAFIYTLHYLLWHSMTSLIATKAIINIPYQ